jgi:archaellum component FlaF (FlaF/FlaG flagellin family)
MANMDMFNNEYSTDSSTIYSPRIINTSSSVTFGNEYKDIKYEIQDSSILSKYESKSKGNYEISNCNDCYFMDYNSNISKKYKNGYPYWYNDSTTTTSGASYTIARIEDWIVDSSKTRRIANPRSMLRGIIAARQSPIVIIARESVAATMDERETRARETLARMLGQDKFRAFLKNGFMSARAKSGKVYQIFPGHGITCVYENGKMIERLCVVMQGGFPPTDSVIMRYLLIMNNEAEFREMSIPHSVSTRKRFEIREAKEDRPLPEVFAELKLVA